MKKGHMVKINVSKLTPVDVRKLDDLLTNNYIEGVPMLHRGDVIVDKVEYRLYRVNDPAAFKRIKAKMSFVPYAHLVKPVVFNDEAALLALIKE